MARSLIFLLFVALVPLHAASVSKQQADVFARKVVLIQRQADQVERAGMRRTALTEDELNSWFAYQARPLLPAGVTDPKVTIIGGGRVAGQATVDLDAIAKRRSSGGTLDPWSYIGGRVPVNVVGTLRTRDGTGQFDLQSADISGLPVPKTLLQEVVTYYSRTPENPRGVRIDDQFALPARIKQIEVAQGQAIIVQ
jgi:hypothetical protein